MLEEAHYVLMLLSRAPANCFSPACQMLPGVRLGHLVPQACRDIESTPPPGSKEVCKSHISNGADE